MEHNEKTVRIIMQDSHGELEDRRSRFLAVLHPVHSEEEALAFIAGIKKQYWDARHHCFAYIVDGGRLVRCSDDGEPQGTAGRPILDVLTGANLQDVICVVTRYFGGTLLGTGGLVRAYAGAASDALSNAVLLTRRDGIRLCLQMAYTDLGKVQYLLGQKGIAVTDSQYADDVRLWIVIPLAEEAQLKDDLTEATGARIAWPERDEVLFAQGGKEPIILEN